MKRMRALLIVAVALAASVPSVAWAEVITFKLLANYSRATFKSDAMLETFVGNTAAEGVQGMLMVDPAKPAEAKGNVRVDMNAVKTGIEKRDADMRGKNYLDTEVDANRWVSFEIKTVEITGPLVAGKEVPARITGVLTVKQKSVPRTADGTVTYIRLTPEQVEAQKRFGFTADNIKVRAQFGTLFTNHNMQVPQLLFLKVSNEIQIETDLTFVRQ